MTLEPRPSLTHALGLLLALSMTLSAVGCVGLPDDDPDQLDSGILRIDGDMGPPAEDGGLPPTRDVGPRPTGDAGPMPEDDVIEQVVDAEGATLVLGDVVIDVPAGALPTPATLRISATPTAAPGAVFADGVEPAGTIYTFEPHGIEFAAPVTVSLPHDGGTGVHRLDDEQDPDWEPVAVVDFALPGQVIFTTRTFSLYVVTHARQDRDPTVRDLRIEHEGHLVLAPGEMAVLDAQIEVEEGTSPRVRWSSSDEGVATVNGFGEVRGVGAGTAMIRVTAVADDGAFDEIEATVTDPCAPRPLAVGETGRALYGPDNCGTMDLLGGAFADSPMAGIHYAAAFSFTVPERGYYDLVTTGLPQMVAVAVEADGHVFHWGARLTFVGGPELLEPGVTYRAAIGIDRSRVEGFATEGPLTFTVARIPEVGTRLDISEDYTRFCAGNLHGSYQVEPGRSTLFADLIGNNTGCSARDRIEGGQYGYWHTYRVVQADAPPGTVTAWRVCSDETEIQVRDASGEVIGDFNGSTAPSADGWAFDAEPYTPYYLMVFSDARWRNREPDNVRVTTGHDCSEF